MTLILEAGWPQIGRASCSTDLVPGTRNVRPELCAGDAACVLVAWAAWFHRNVRNIEPIDGHRSWWGWSATNDVWNSNHLGGVALDLCADELPWQRRTMPQNQVDVVERGLALFEGNVFWGRHWDRVDEMHFQVGYNTFNNPRFAEFAARLRAGYLNIYGPPDPDAFPLPKGYYYGPLDGPTESISGEYVTDSQAAKDGLGRWQAALGLPVTKRWNDGKTPQAATTLQHAMGWPPNPAFGFGGVYEGEWNVVIRNGWRLPPNWDAAAVPPPVAPLTKWGDYSQYQGALLNDAYPYPVISFRASVADANHSDSGSPTGKAGIDAKWLDNAARAKVMVASGKLKKVIAYHFWVPGADNVGTFLDALTRAGGVYPELAFMLDLERGGDKWNVHGDQSTGVIDFLRRVGDYFVNPAAGSLYWNPNADPTLMDVGRIPVGTKVIVPRYAGPDKAPVVPPGLVVFGHQYASDENTPPFGPTDINQAKLPLDQFLAAWGTNGGPAPVTPPPPPVADPAPVPTPDPPAPTPDPPVPSVPSPGETPSPDTQEVGGHVSDPVRLNGRPTAPASADVLDGHLLSARAEGLINQALLAAIITQLNVGKPADQQISVAKIRANVIRSLS